MSKEAQKYIGNKVEKMMKEKKRPQDQNIAIAYNYAKKRGFKMPSNKNQV